MVCIPLTVIPAPPTQLPKLKARLEIPIKGRSVELGKTRLNTPYYVVANPALAINAQARTSTTLEPLSVPFEHQKNVFLP